MLLYAAVLCWLTLHDAHIPLRLSGADRRYGNHTRTHTLVHSARRLKFSFIYISTQTEIHRSERGLCTSVGLSRIHSSGTRTTL